MKFFLEGYPISLSHHLIWQNLWVANSGFTWGWCLFEGIKNFRLAFSGRLINFLLHWVTFLSMDDLICSENILAVIKTMVLYQHKLLPTQSYWSNIFSSFRVHLDWKTLFTTFYSFESRKSNLFLLLISPWTQIKQLSP